MVVLSDETRHQARQEFINNIPEVLTSLMGAQSSQRGAQKIFDTLQNHMQNKQLFYVSTFQLYLFCVPNDCEAVYLIAQHLQ